MKERLGEYMKFRVFVEKRASMYLDVINPNLI